MNFYDPTQFEFLKPIKDNFETILSEFNAIKDSTMPWMEKDLYTGKWDVIGFRYENQDFQKNKELAPKTCELFDSLGDKIFTYGFSILRPECELKPHTGDVNTVLRAHLCLYTNDNCALVINDEPKTWTVGEFLVFDDTNLHYSYNRGTTDRVVLLFDFYK
jgi:beta-hydroxylase